MRGTGRADIGGTLAGLAVGVAGETGGGRRVGYSSEGGAGRETTGLIEPEVREALETLFSIETALAVGRTAVTGG